MKFIRLRELRESAGITKKGMAQSIGVSPSTYTRYEGGGKIPLRIVIALALYHKVSADYIVGLTDDPLPKRPI